MLLLRRLRIVSSKIIFLLLKGVFYLGFKFGTSHCDGAIILDKNEDGDDRIIFQLNMEYDDIAAKNQIVFKVQKK